METPAGGRLERFILSSSLEHLLNHCFLYALFYLGIMGFCIPLSITVTYLLKRTTVTQLGDSLKPVNR